MPGSSAIWEVRRRTSATMGIPSDALPPGNGESGTGGAASRALTKRPESLTRSRMLERVSDSLGDTKRTAQSSSGVIPLLWLSALGLKSSCGGCRLERVCCRGRGGGCGERVDVGRLPS